MGRQSPTGHETERRNVSVAGRVLNGRPLSKEKTDLGVCARVQACAYECVFMSVF